MNLSVGIVGLPNVGKSTLFNALLKKQVAAVQNYPFTTIEPNVGVVSVPDARLGQLADLVAKSTSEEPKLTSEVLKKPPIVPAVVKFVDIAGLVKGAAQGEGLGNQFLAHIREVDAIVFVLRGFKNEDIVRAGSENPQEDLEVLKAELLLKDLETITKRLDSFSKELKSVSPNDVRHQTLKIMEKAKTFIGEGKWLGDVLSGEELEKIADLQLLSCKKSIVVLNSDEEALTDVILGSPSTSLRINSTTPESKKEGFWTSQNDNYVRISAKMEEELASLAQEEQKQYLRELGIGEPGLDRLIKKAYETLGLITFFTAGPKEIHAWTIKEGTRAPQAAGAIHSDFERGFIAADVIEWDKLVDAGGWQSAKDRGMVKTIGKSEEIRDGMVVEFRFSV